MLIVLHANRYSHKYPFTLIVLQGYLPTLIFLHASCLLWSSLFVPYVYYGHLSSVFNFMLIYFNAYPCPWWSALNLELIALFEVINTHLLSSWASVTFPSPTPFHNPLPQPTFLEDETFPYNPRLHSLSHIWNLF